MFTPTSGRADYALPLRRPGLHDDQRVGTLLDDEKGLHTLRTHVGTQNVTLINEPGLYSVVREGYSEVSTSSGEQVMTIINESGLYSVIREGHPAGCAGYRNAQPPGGQRRYTPKGEKE